MRTRLLAAGVATLTGLLTLGVMSPAQAADTRPPLITIGTDALWHNEDVDVEVVVQDDPEEPSGVAEVTYTLSNVTTGSGTLSATGGVVTIGNHGVTNISVTARDNAGLTATQTGFVRIDKNLPTILVQGRFEQPGQVLAVGEEASLIFSCDDVPSEIAECYAEIPVAAGGGTASNGHIVHTDEPGQYTYTVVALDNAGNETERDVTYTVEGGIDIEATELPSIAGTPRVFETLAGDPGAYTPEPDDVDCVWVVDDEPTDSGVSFQAWTHDLGSTFVYTCRVEVGATVELFSSDPVVVQPADYDIELYPSLSGEGVVGSTLRVDHEIHGAEGPTFLYQWRRNDRPIPGATGREYVVTPDDAGTELDAVVTAFEAGFGGQDFITPALRIDGQPRLTFDTDPGLAGAAVVGGRLTVTPPAVSSSWGTTEHALSVQWLRDGQPIPGQTATSYALTPADYNHRIAVRVTATAAGHQPATATARASNRVAAAVATLQARVKPLGKGRSWATIDVTAPGVVPTGVVTIRHGAWIVGQGQLHDGRLVVRLARQPKGKKRYVVTYWATRGVTPAQVTVRARIR